MAHGFARHFIGKDGSRTVAMNGTMKHFSFPVFEIDAKLMPQEKQCIV